MRPIQYMAALACAAVLPACAADRGVAGAPRIAQVRGAALEYVDNGVARPPVVFLHGAVTDLRMWHPHRAAMGTDYRTVAYTQRYHGTGPWRRGWPAYGVNTHSQDLTEFLERLGAGPVHLVAWSYAGHIALDAALRRPDLFRSLFIYEPGVPSYVEDAAALAAQRADAMAAFGPIFDAIRGSDSVAALKLLLDASGQSVGYFDRQAAASKAIQLDNARTMAELLLRQEAPPQITCAQLARLQVPARVAYGANSRPLYSVVGAAAQRCIGGAGHLVAQGRTHMWPEEDPLGFTSAVLDFIKDR